MKDLPFNKKVPLQNTVEAFIHFVIYLLLVTPIIIVIVIPCVLIYQTLIKVGIIPIQTITSTTVDRWTEPPEVRKKSSDRSDRKYDLVLFGATGFTGHLVCRYLASHYGDKINWAIAGRSKDKLEKIRNELLLDFPKVKEVGLFLADSNDILTIKHLTKQTKVVATTAGKIVPSCFAFILIYNLSTCLIIIYRSFY
jgi:hypothetical protein